MKKTLIILIIMSILCSALIGTTIVASASSSVYDSYNIPESTEIINGNSISIARLSNSDGDGIGFKLTGGYFGSEYSNIALAVSVYDAASYSSTNDFGSDITTLMNEIHSTVNYIDTLANTQYEQSDVYKFNMADEGDTISISDMTAEMIMYAQTMYDITDGAYNPAVYRLVDLWGFSSRVWSNGGSGLYAYDRDSYKDLPEEKYIEAFMDLCDFNLVTLEGSEGNYTLTKNCPSVTVDGVTYSQWIDLGGIAKGYAVELVADILESYGYEHYFIDCGSSSGIFTSYEDGSGTYLGLSVPEQWNWTSEVYVTVPLQDTVYSTSGLYNRSYTVDEVTYSHIIDGSTGYPVEYDMPTVSVVGSNAWAADCLTTAFTIMGAEGIADFVNDDGLTQVLNVGDSMTSSLYLTGLYSYTDDDLGIITNFSSSDILYVNDEYQIVSQMTESGFLIVIPEANSYTWLIVLASILAVVAIGVLLYVRFHHPRGEMFAVDNVRSGRMFIKSDIVVYTLLVVLIISLFWVFVFTAEDEEYEQLQIIDTLTDDIIFTYNKETGKYIINYSARLDIEVVESEDGCLCVYILNEGETDLDNFINLLCIEPDGTAKMTDAVCGYYEECVNSFPAITSVNGVIVCSPNNIKVVAVGGVE